MKKLLVLVAAFTLVGQTFSTFRTGNPLRSFSGAPTSGNVAAEVAPVAKVVAAEVSDLDTGFVANVKAFQKEALAKAEVMISANPKAAVAYTVLATLVLEQVLSFVYNNFVASNDDNNYEDDEDLDIA